MMSTPLTLLLSLLMVTTPSTLLKPVILGGAKTLKSTIKRFEPVKRRISAWLSLKPFLPDLNLHVRKLKGLNRESKIYLRYIFYDLSSLNIYLCLTRNDYLQSLTNCKREILFTHSRERNSFNCSFVAPSNLRGTLLDSSYAYHMNSKRNSLRVLIRHERHLKNRFTKKVKTCCLCVKRGRHIVKLCVGL